MLPRPKKEITESKELNSKDKKKMQHPNQEEQRKERQILKDKQQVKKKRKEKSFTQGTRTKKEKLESEIRDEGLKKEKKIRYIAHWIYFMSFAVDFYLHSSRPIEFI